MRKSKVERAAEVLDEKMRVQITHFRVSIYVLSTDIRALDAVASLAGQDAVCGYPGRTVKWRCGKQGAILVLLQQCIPFMCRQKELAEAIVEFLKADTAQGILVAMSNVWTLRRSRRHDNWDGQ